MVKQPTEKYFQNGNGRRRNYTCRNCGERFELFLCRPLPEGAQYCHNCRAIPEIRRKFDEAYQKRMAEESR